jgi:hypothetical protein
VWTGKIAAHLMECYQHSPSSIVIITFYSAQVARVRSELQKRGLSAVKVHTVDSFQGSEADVVILSFVRANAHHTVGFTADFRRLNVAITRAQRSLIALAHAGTLSSARGDKEANDLAALIAEARGRGALHEEEDVARAMAHVRQGGAQPQASPAQPARSKAVVGQKRRGADHAENSWPGKDSAVASSLAKKVKKPTKDRARPATPSAIGGTELGETSQTPFLHKAKKKKPISGRDAAKSRCLAEVSEKRGSQKPKEETEMMVGTSAEAVGEAMSFQQAIQQCTVQKRAAVVGSKKLKREGRSFSFA